MKQYNLINKPKNKVYDENLIKNLEKNKKEHIDIIDAIYMINVDQMSPNLLSRRPYANFSVFGRALVFLILNCNKFINLKCIFGN